MPRLLFEKKGNAVWISHLDLMRLFQRAFKRAGLPLKHTQGFNPKPSVSIALPLSVGTESNCELLDFDLDSDFSQWDLLPNMLNSVLVDGVRVHKAYLDGKKIRDLALMRSLLILEYDKGVPIDSKAEITDLLNKPELKVIKKTKSGLQEQDIIPLIRSFTIMEGEKNTLELEVLHCCQNPTLNPMQIPAAIAEYLPQFIPNFSKCCRIEIYDSAEQIFR